MKFSVDGDGKIVVDGSNCFVITRNEMMLEFVGRPQRFMKVVNFHICGSKPFKRMYTSWQALKWIWQRGHLEKK